MESTWESRDLPVLEAIVKATDDAGPGVSVQQIEAATGLTRDDVQRAIRALMHERPPLFTTGKPRASGDITMIGQVTGDARRRVGSWPTPENLADRIVAALQQAADDAATPEEQSRLRKAAEAVGGVGKGVITGVLTHVLTNGI